METTLTKNETQNGAVAEQRERRYLRKPEYSVSEGDHGYVVRVELPGVAKEDIDLSVEERVLTLEAKRKEQLPENWKALRTALPPHDYRLRLSLSDDVDGQKVEARLENGVLALTLSKREEARPRRIEVA
ncbi:MAG: Hsp20/alpha crystallin family protein [Verrucomicrobiota bacterium]